MKRGDNFENGQNRKNIIIQTSPGRIFKIGNIPQMVLCSRPQMGMGMKMEQNFRIKYVYFPHLLFLGDLE